MTEITPASDWAPPSEVVTLPTGRTARLRNSLPVYMLLRAGIITGAELTALESAANGNLEDPEVAVKLFDVVCEAMFLEPKVSADGAPGTVPLDHLEQSDQDFVLARAFGGTPSEAFPERQGGDGDSGDSKVLADEPVKPRRAAKRKPAGARSRQRAGKATG